MRSLLKSSTEQPLLFLLVESADHITPLTGASPTVTLSKNGGSFGSPSGSVSEIGNGWYMVAANATDTGTLGPLVLHATATSGDPADIYFEVVAFDPQDSVRMGMTALPNAAAAASGGLLISGSNAGTTTLAALTVTGALTVSDGIAVSRTTTNATAITATGNGTGNGVSITSGGGANSNGLYVSAPSGLNGAAVLIAGGSTQAGLIAQGGTGGASFSATASGAAGVSISGDGSGAGLEIAAGTSGDGVTINAGNTGAGLTIAGGMISGDAVDITVTSGNGLSIAGAGSGNAALNLAGTSSAVTSIGVVSASVTQWLGTAPASPNTAGIPLVDLDLIKGTASAGAGGYVGVDWSAIDNQAATVDFSGTTIAVASNASGSALSTGTAQAGASSSITLASGESSVAGVYAGDLIVLTSGTGKGQAASITAYNTSTKVATVYGTWGTTPDNTSVYAIYAGAPVAIQAGTAAGQLAASSGVVSANAVQIDGQTTAASGTVTFPGSVGTSTLTQAQVTGGAWALQTDSSGYMLVSSGSGTGQVNLSAGNVTLAGVTFPTHFSALAITSAGNVGIDWSNVANPTTAQDLSGTTIAGTGGVQTYLASGTAQGGAGGASSTITLAAGASATPGAFVGATIAITAGTGAGQSNRVTAYNTSTKVASVYTPWVTTPDDTSTYVITAGAPVTVESGTGAGQINLAAGNVALAAGAITDASLASGAITAATFASGAISSAAFASAAVPPSALFAVDGLALDSMLTAVLAVLLGTTNVSGSQVQFLQQDGSTVKVEITYGSTAGQRTATVVS